MDKDFYISLIYKELKGELSDAEVQTLEAFYKESAANRDFRDEVQLSWMLSQNTGESKPINVDVELDLKKVKTDLGHAAIEKPTKVISMWRRIGSVAAILIPLAVGAFFLFQFFNNPSSKIHQASNEVKVLDLTDGSRVWLNKNSQVELAADFNEENRNVKLDGEAFFDVAKNDQRPFIIQANDLKITVVGTSFNVKENKNQLVVSVVSGTVKVESKNDSKILTKDEKAIYSKSDHQILTAGLSNKNELFWKTGTFIYKGESLSEVMLQLENIFSKKIKIENTALESCGISLASNASDFQTILKKVADAVHAEIKDINSETIQILGGRCN